MQLQDWLLSSSLDEWNNTATITPLVMLEAESQNPTPGSECLKHVEDNHKFLAFH